MSLIEPGYYDATLESIVADTSPEKGTPCMRLTFDIGGGTTRDVFLYLSDAAIEYTEEKLSRLGFNGDFSNPSCATVDVQLSCKHEEYEGKTREKWDIAGGRREAKAFDASLARRLSARWKSKYGASKPPAGKPAAPPPAAEPSPPDDETEPAPAWNKQRAWSTWEDASPDGQPDREDWKKAVRAIGKPEAQFTGDDWKAVAEAATPL